MLQIRVAATYSECNVLWYCLCGWIVSTSWPPTFDSIQSFPVLSHNYRTRTLSWFHLSIDDFDGSHRCTWSQNSSIVVHTHTQNMDETCQQHVLTLNWLPRRTFRTLFGVDAFLSDGVRTGCPFLARLSAVQKQDWMSRVSPRTASRSQT